jgi:hypothetical protein
MRLRTSAERFRRLQARLNRNGHGAGDPYRKTKIDEFWETLRYDKRLAEGEI